jgi:WD40 repeat protein
MSCMDSLCIIELYFTVCPCDERYAEIQGQSQSRPIGDGLAKVAVFKSGNGGYVRRTNHRALGDNRMDFTELYKQSGGLCQFSPCGRLVATAVQHRCVVRDSESLQILHLYTCLNPIQDIQWCQDSNYILCASYKSGAVHVWSILDEKWTAKIDEAVAGMVKCRWAPDGRHVLTWSDFQVGVAEKESRWRSRSLNQMHVLM